MKVVIQRVNKAKVSVDGVTVAAIEKGLLVFLGVGHNDTEKDIEYLADKIVNLRIYDDERGKMHYSVTDKKFGILVVPQFTIMGNCNKGRRPDFTDAADPEKGKTMFMLFVKMVKSRVANTAQGIFKANMQVELINDGPATFVIDTLEKSEKA